MNHNFERGKNPKMVLGLGIFTPHDFICGNDLWDHLAKYMSVIIGLPQLPEDFINSKKDGGTHSMKIIHIEAIYNYMDSFLTVRGQAWHKDGIIRALMNRLPNNVKIRRARYFK